MLRLSRRMYTETHIRIQTHTHRERESYIQKRMLAEGSPRQRKDPQYGIILQLLAQLFSVHTCTRTYACVQLYVCVCVLSVVRVRKKRN